MQVDRLYLDRKLFNLYEVKDSIPMEHLPELYRDYLGDDESYYYIEASGNRVTVKPHDIFVNHLEYYMVLNGEWCRLEVEPYK